METFVEFKSISKYFTGVQALNDVSFRADGGAVCALLGENGAGKSTLLKILSGAQPPDSGCCNLNGADVAFGSPYDAIKAGVSIIYQERQLVENLTVTENIFMEFLPKLFLNIVNFSKAHAEAQKIIDMFKLPIDPRAEVGKLSVAHQQMVEIMKAVRRNSQVIAFDEPTACLSDTEVDALFEVIERLKEEGKVILYVTHRLKELFQISDSIVVLKDGQFVKKLNTTEVEERELIRLMVGRDLGDLYKGDKRAGHQNEAVPILEAKSLSNDMIKDVSFTLHKGEILGFAGLVGAGRSEIMAAICGVDSISSGEVFVEGKKVNIKNPRDAIKAGIGICPEDRKEQGLVLGRSIRENVSLPILGNIAKLGILNRKKEKKIASEAVEDYNVKTHSIEKIVVELSGGNQQKVILGRWTSAELKVLILDEPTKGVDVGAKSEIYQMVYDLASKGLGVIFISSELPEVINVCDRVIVIKEGRIAGTLLKDKLSEESVLTLAMKGAEPEH